MFFSSFFFFLYLLLLFLFVFCFCVGGVFFDFFVFCVGGLDISFSFVFDYVSLGFFSCVSFISSMVFLYSNFYMDGTVDGRRFLWLVFGFVLSMFFLVFSGNFFLTMVGWDGLGLISFCLVIFYSNHGSLESGLVTVFSNRVGDVFFLVCMFFFFMGGTFSFDVGAGGCGILFFVFLFLGAITKSAQLPFSAWLPAAMAAPTPVSSLVHSSTLVTAGVYVLIRFSFVFLVFDFFILKVFFILTMFVAGVSANFESDFKKIVAMSTLSQLGMMLFILSVGVWVMSYLHMIIHAFFKSMLFLSTGSLMSHLGGNQDSRFYGGGKLSFGSFLFFFVSCFCLSGFPFFIGFYSKDFIILSSSFVLGLSFYFFFLVSCVFTVLYSLRLVFSGYFFFVKGYSFSLVSEDYSFLLPVSFLFFKGWILGGLFYWGFLSDSVVFFCFFDVFTGLVLLGVGLVFFSFIFLAYRLFFFFCMISFMRWFSSGGSSFSFDFMNLSKLDSTWVEVLGGQGSYLFLARSSYYLDSYKNFGLGVLFIFMVVFGVIFFF